VICCAEISPRPMHPPNGYVVGGMLIGGDDAPTADGCSDMEQMSVCRATRTCAAFTCSGVVVASPPVASSMARSSFPARCISSENSSPPASDIHFKINHRILNTFICITAALSSSSLTFVLAADTIIIITVVFVFTALLFCFNVNKIK